jgi:hypothetical protein
MSFSASFDRTAKIISGVVCLILLAVVIALHSLFASCLAMSVLALSLAYSPRGYVVEGRRILIRRLAGAATVSLDDIREVRTASREDLRGCIRLWGSGGLFGYCGVFSTDRLGKSTWYVTSRSKMVVVRTAAKTVLVSPDDTKGFLATVQSAAPVPASGFASPFEAPGFDTVGSGRPGFDAPGRSFSRLRWSILLGVAACVVALTVFVTSYAPGVPAYTLTGDSLTIHDRFYPVTLQASSVDIQQIRIVDLATETEWRPVVRTNGFAVAHYRSGWFRVANGQKVRLYRADGQRVVLLPPTGDGSPVLYEAADPEMFVSQVRSAWSRLARSRTNAGKWIHYAL